MATSHKSSCERQAAQGITSTGHQVWSLRGHKTASNSFSEMIRASLTQCWSKIVAQLLGQVGSCSCYSDHGQSSCVLLNRYISSAYSVSFIYTSVFALMKTGTVFFRVLKAFLSPFSSSLWHHNLSFYIIICPFSFWITVLNVTPVFIDMTAPAFQPSYLLFC